MTPSEPSTDRTHVFQRSARFLAGAILLIAGLVLFGWKTQNHTLIYIAPGFAAMKVNTAVAFLGCSIALFCLAKGPSARGGWNRIAGMTCGTFVSLIGAATMVEYGFGLDLKIDQLLIPEAPSAIGSYFPGRMSDLSAFNFLVLGAALSLSFARRPSRLAQALIFCGVLGTLLAGMGHLYGINPIHASAHYTPIALHATVAFLLLCLGLFCARPDCEFMQLWTSDGVSGTMVRRLCPAALLVPLVGGAIFLFGHRRELVGVEQETLIFAGGVILLFSGVVCWNGWVLFRSEESKARVESALNESMRRFVFLADAMPQIVWTARPDGGLDYYNKAWHDYTGLTFEQTKDWGWGPVLHPDDLAQCIERWTKSVSSGNPYEVEYRFKRAADGAYRWHLGRAVAMRDADGAINQWVGTCTDIHEQKTAKDELARHVAERTAELSVANTLLQSRILERDRAEERNRQILAHSLDVICTIDERGCFSQVSAAAREVFGYEPKDLIGRRYIDLVHPQDHARTNEAAGAIMRGAAAADFENRYIRKDGSLVTISWAANWSEAEKTMFCVARDITDRHHSTEQLRASEERFRSVAQSLGDAIISSDARGEIIFWNQAAETIFGHTAAEALGRPLSLIMPERFRARHDEGLRRHQATGEARVIGQTVELIGLHKDGREFPVELSLSTWETGEGRFYTGIVRDITARLKIKEELRAAKEAAEAASRAKSEFLANVSHEIRTPLNGILGMTELALELALSDEVRKHLGVVKTSGLSLLALLNDLLDFSKIEAGKLTLEKIAFDFRARLEATIAPLRVRAENKGLNLLLHIAPEVPATLIGDPTRLGQVITNLVDNAIKFTDSGIVRVEIGQKEHSLGKTRLAFVVADTGVGIPQEKQGIIFEAFEQADGSTTRHYGGTGLGLGICARLVEQMQGRIEVESAPGQGSKFKFSASFGVANDAPPSLQEEAAEKQTAAPARAGLHILIAEDNPVNRAVAAGLLQHTGHRVSLANDGHDAVSLYRRERFDLILMDVQMPALDGLAATREIRSLEAKLGRSAPIIAMTAHAMEGDRERCLAAGMNAYLPKPLTREALLAAIGSVVTAVAPAGRDFSRATRPGQASRNELLDEFEGDSDLLDRLSDLFVENTPKVMAALQEAAAREDGKALEQLAHSLLSSFGVFRAQAATKLALRLEEAGRKEDFAEIPGHLGRLQDETNRLLTALAADRSAAG